MLCWLAQNLATTLISGQYSMLRGSGRNAKNIWLCQAANMVKSSTALLPPPHHKKTRIFDDLRSRHSVLQDQDKKLFFR